jgi:hypothetical protein
MIKSKVTGFIDLGNGPIDLGNGPIEVHGEAVTTPPLLDPEFMEQTRNLKEAIERVKRTVIKVAIGDDGIHVPTGPVVDSTIAEERQ